MLTGRRQFKRTGMEETVKTKWELRMQERKKQQTIVHEVGTLSYSFQLWTGRVKL